MTDFLYKEESYEIIGACMKIHSALGCGYKETIYQDALEVELINRKLSFVKEKNTKLFMKASYLNIILLQISLFLKI